MEPDFSMNFLLISFFSLFFRYAALYLEHCCTADRSSDARDAMLAARAGPYCSGIGLDTDLMCSVCLMHCATRGWEDGGCGGGGGGVGGSSVIA